MRKIKKITLGKDSNGKAIEIDLGILLRTRALVMANSGGGKSWLLRRLAEQMFGSVPVWIIDPEGEFATLREKFGFFLVGKGGETPADPRSAPLVAHKLLELGASAVFDLYDLKAETRHRWVKVFLDALVDAPKHLWRPLVLKLDEAHVYCPEKGQGESEAYGSVVDIATRGRKRGICAMLYTQRIAKLSKNASAELVNRLVGRTTEGVDVKRAADIMSVPREGFLEFKDKLKKFRQGEFFAQGPAIADDTAQLKVGPVQTTHPEPGSTTYSASPPPPPEKIQALLPKLQDLPKEAEEKAKTEGDLRSEIRSLKAQLLARPKVEKVVAPAPAKVVEKIVEVPAIEKSVVRKIYKIVKTWEKALDKLKPLEKIGEQASGLTTSLIGMVETSIKKVEGVKKGPVISTALRPIVAKPVAKIIPKMKPIVEVAQADLVEGNGELSNPQRAILRGLREFDENGLPSVSRHQLAGWLGKKVSGSYLNDLSKLRGLGFINYHGKRLVLTEEGLAQSPNVECDPTAEAIFDHVLLAVSGPQREVLKACKNNFPEWVAREDVAQSLGKTVSGSFLNDLSRLRTSEMIEYGLGDLKGHIRLCGWTMLAEVPV